MFDSKNKSHSKLPATIKIAVVDDHELFRAGVISLLRDYEEFNVVIEAANGKILLEKLKRNTPHIILLDIEMPVMRGAEAILLLKQNYPHIKIIILTMHNQEEFIFDLILKGASAFLPKDKSVESLVDTIYAVMEKGYLYSDQITSAIIKGTSGVIKVPEMLQKASLTEREVEIVKLICTDKSNKEIADTLCISSRTVDHHKKNIFLKIGANTTTGIVMFAIKTKLIAQ